MKIPIKLIFLSIFLFIAFIKTYVILVNNLYMVWQLWLPIISWLIGGIGGYIVLEFDRLVDIYVTYPDSKLAIITKQYFFQKKYNQGWKILMLNKKLQKHLTFRSAIFQTIWILLAIFTLTSTNSLFSKGFVLGLGLHLLLEEWQDFLTDPNYLKQWLFWQINRVITIKETKIYLIAISALISIFFFSILWISL